jgi:lipopolysaccharide/colanic/teichoic acid biosynthesis glycosyltransferase
MDRTEAATGSVTAEVVYEAQDPASLSDGEVSRRNERSAQAWLALKRSMDIVLSAVLLLLLLPIIACIALLVRLDSPGPMFFRCDRVGRGGRRLRMLKFRKMHDGARGVPLTITDDQRFTRIGQSLAKYKLDELPQFWHVLRGEMSLVGPRPESDTFVARFPREYDRILQARPGIFGLSQLAFADESRILDRQDPAGDYVKRILPQKMRMDCFYLDHQGIVLDVRILWWSAVTVVLRRPVAVHRETGKVNFRRPRADPVVVRTQACEARPASNAAATVASDPAAPPYAPALSATGSGAHGLPSATAQYGRSTGNRRGA